MKLDKLPHYKSVMLLQGPVGPFFKKFSEYLKKKGTRVSKINFNLGDDLFYCTDVYRFKDEIDLLPTYLEKMFIQTSAEAIFLFGDHRQIHIEAISIAKKMGMDIWVFEEGYIRPGYLTLERNASHSFSPLIDLWTKSSAEVGKNIEETLPIKCSHSFVRMVVSGFLYFTLGLFSHFFYPYYKHHKEFGLAQGFFWFRSFIRKVLYYPIDKARSYKLFRDYKKKYFLVPLQVATDFAVLDHSKYKKIQFFIEEVIKSFANTKEKHNLLVFKHHPMDRGYSQYAGFIRKCAKFYGIKDRVVYLHDTNAVKLIKNSYGVVVINSTIGLQVLYHGIPIKIMGNSLYDKKGLTHQGSLDSFWENPQPVSAELFYNFRKFLISECQVPGSFYDTSWLEKLSENNVILP